MQWLDKELDRSGAEKEIHKIQGKPRVYTMKSLSHIFVSKSPTFWARDK